MTIQINELMKGEYLGGRRYLGRRIWGRESGRRGVKMDIKGATLQLERKE